MYGSDSGLELEQPHHVGKFKFQKDVINLCNTTILSTIRLTCEVYPHKLLA